MNYLLYVSYIDYINNMHNILDKLSLCDLVSTIKDKGLKSPV